MVTISCITKFHAFNLAEQLERNALLSRLYTAYASQKHIYVEKFVKRVDKEKISPEKVYVHFDKIVNNFCTSVVP